MSNYRNALVRNLRDIDGQLARMEVTVTVLDQADARLTADMTRIRAYQADLVREEREKAIVEAQKRKDEEQKRNDKKDGQGGSKD